MAELPKIKELLKLDEVALLEFGLKKDAAGKLRTTKGHYVPGQSGRISKPKDKVKPTKDSTEFIPAEIRKLYGDNPLTCMQEMLKLAATKADAVRISKELLPYTHPKLASIEQKTFNFHSGNIEVLWQDDNGQYITSEVIEDESGGDTEEMLQDDTSDSEDPELDGDTIGDSDIEDNPGE